MKRIAIAAIALSSLAGAAFAAGPTPKASPAAKPAPKAAADVYCAVTHEKIGPAKNAAGSEVYKGKTYYFCCMGCKPMFDKNPAKYAVTASAATKPANKMSGHMSKMAPKPAASPAAKQS